MMPRALSVLALVGLLFWLALSARPAAAHAVPVASRPAANSIVADAPERLEITFNEPIVPLFSQIQLFNQTGELVATGPLEAVTADNITVAVSLPPLNAGTYLVNWRALSAVDGHTTTGSYPLGIGVAELAAASSPTVSAQLTPLSAAGRWLNLTGLALLIGLFSFRLLVWWPTYGRESLTPAEQALDRRQARAGLVVGGLGALLVGVGLLLLLLFQARQNDLFVASRFLTWLRTPFGAMWGVRLLLLGVLAAVLWQLNRALKIDATRLRAGAGWWLGLVVSLGLLVTVAQVSHSAALAEGRALATAVDFVHGLGAGIWAGGLLMLGLTLWLSRQLEEADRHWLALSLNVNFSTLAAGAVGLLLLSGGYLAWQHVGSWTALLGTLYGRALLLKVGLALPALAIAAANLLFIRPRLDALFDTPGAPAARTVLRRFGWLVRLEALLALLVLAGAGLVSDLQRGADAPLLADQPGRRALTQTADNLTVTLTLEPALVGVNTFDIYVVDGNGRPVTDAREVALRFTFLSRAIGAADAIAENVGGGHYQLEGSYLSLIGGWQIEVAVRRPGAFDAFVPYRLEAGLGGALQPAADADRLGRLARFMTQSNGLVSGLFLVLGAIGWGFLAARAARRDWQLVPLLLIGVVAFWIGGFQLYNFYQDFTPAMFATNPHLPDADSIAIGRALFEERCAACHGPEGRGDGPGAAGLYPPPADFASGHTETHSDGDLYYWIKRGVANTAMPAFETQLTDDEIWHIVNYVRRLSTGSTGVLLPTPTVAVHSSHQ